MAWIPWVALALAVAAVAVVALNLVGAWRWATRTRALGSRVVPTPWEGRWSDYREQDGMRVPFTGEVAWILPEGRQPYWRGTITALSYEFAH